MELGCNVFFLSFFLNNNVIPGNYIAKQKEITENNVAKQFHVAMSFTATLSFALRIELLGRWFSGGSIRFQDKIPPEKIKPQTSPGTKIPT